MRLLAVTGLNSDVHVRFFLVAFGALWRKSLRAQKGGLYANALAEVASLGGLTRVAYFPFFVVACIAVLV